MICRANSRHTGRGRQAEVGVQSDRTRLVQHFGADAEDVEHMAERYLDEQMPGAVQLAPVSDPRPRSGPLHTCIHASFVSKHWLAAGLCTHSATPGGWLAGLVACPSCRRLLCYTLC